MKGKVQFRVRYAETDAMGIVHHANYYAWFEMGRTELFRDLDLEYRVWEDEGIFCPVIETHCKYKVPAKYDDMLTLETEITHVGKVRWTFVYRLYREEILLAVGKTVHCFMNQAGRPVVLKKVNFELFTNLVEKGLIQE